ncbi:MAG: hypothetical protein Q8K59_08040 [Nitrosomonas sp.]|nr:hypothetical protein [Nitrosomonas sp.]MDP1951027.1 hypothetical protein [Nitrosomonas sp.]
MTQHMMDRQGNIFCEQRSIVTKRGKQASRKAAARKYGFLEVPIIQR